MAPNELAASCANGDDGAWAEFMRRYHHVLQNAAIRVSRQWGQGTPDEIDDVLQEIYLKVCLHDSHALTSFRDPRPEAMFGFLKVVATNAAHNYFRKTLPTGGADTKTVSLDELISVPGLTDDIEKRLTLSEIEESVLRLTQSRNGSRDRVVFWFHYRQGLTSRAISELPGLDLTQKGVESILQRLVVDIRHDLRGRRKIAGKEGANCVL